MFDVAPMVRPCMPDTATISILERNLAALSISSPRAAALIRATAPRPDVEFAAAEDGAVAATLGAGPSGRALCSRRRPLEEAQRLAATIDVAQAAGVVVLGFGAGHHVRAMLDRMARTGVVFVFEPDAALLRAVLERIDHSAWLSARNLIFLTDADDAGSIAGAIRGVEGLLAMGVKFLEHPADRARLGETSRRFQEHFAEVIRAMRTAVVTTLMQSETTFRNLLMNLDRYAVCPGVEDLRGAARGRPAIVVAAGPSLRRNMDLLARPGVRERFVIIAVQTALKPLLARGIRPHFVTALDYHEISRRFYEGLTEADVEGVTLVADPKANPAILEAFPGAIRMPGDAMLPGDRAILDELLGPELARPMGTLPPGATVAHMAYYLARHLGCDPVILIGQDLGFTDGVYYGAGAAIHQVWSGELNEFNTLEMMEWQRIARLRHRLPDGQFNARPTTDVLGRKIYTDEQMATYLVQFERDFTADAERGLTTIDATEGGVAKRATTPMRLAEALERYAPAEPLELPAPAQAPGARARLERVRERVRRIRQEVWRIGECSRRAARLLTEMAEHHSDQARVNRLIKEVHALRDEVETLQPAFGLVQRLNQTGTLKRARADRQLAIEEPGLSPMERQRRQIERDITNVQWLAETSDVMGRLLDETLAAFDGAPKRTADPVEPVDEGGAPIGPRRVCALIPVDPALSGLGTKRDLGEPFLAGVNPLRMLLLRLARCRNLDGVVLLAADPEAARRLTGPVPESLRLTIVRTDGPPMGERAVAVGAGRRWARACWRGGLGNLSIYDEALAAGVMARVMEESGIDAAAVINADWALIDPALVDAAVERYRQRPDGPGAHRLTFCHAAPGLGCCVIDRALMRDLAERAAAGPAASVGGLLGYQPVAPMADPIARRNCVASPPEVRDAPFRFIPDAAPRRAALIRALAPLGERALEAGAAEIVAAVSKAMAGVLPEAPHELIVELCTGRLTNGVRGMQGGEAAERPVMSLALAGQLFREFAALRADSVVSLAGAGDPLLHPEALRFISLARSSGVAAVHVRTDLLCDPARLPALLDSGVDVISVDLMAESPSAYRAVMGADLFERARTNLLRLLELRAARPARGGLPVPWIVPRITRCDAVYEEIEPFFDRWLMAAGAAVIDPLPAPIPGQRIEPLPLPAPAARRLERGRLLVLSDGRIPASPSDLLGERIVADAARDGLLEAWRRVCSRRQEFVEPKPTGPVLHGAGSRSRVARLEDL